MKYKPSMFNRIIRRNGEMILYNSRIGSPSITVVPINLQDIVLEWLKDTSDSKDDLAYKKLVDWGFLIPNNKKKKAIRDFLRLNYITQPKLELVIHITRDCNFRCTYCYMNFESVVLNESTQEGIVNFIRRNIGSYKSVLINWFGGEALLYPEIIENLSTKIIAICKKAKKPYSAVITTNGYLLSLDVAKMLIRCHVNQFMITIDGIGPLHDSQRMLADGSPTFDKIIDNLLSIKKTIRNGVLSIVIRLNITKKHLPSIEECYDFFDEHFGDDSRFSLFIRAVGNYGGERVVSMIPSFITDTDIANVFYNLSEKHGSINFSYNFKDIEYAGGACSARKQNKFTIGCDGNIYKCDEEVMGDPIGHIDRNGNMEIDVNKFAKYMVVSNRSKRCDECFFSNNCLMSGCPKSYANDILTPCEERFQELDSLIWLESKTVGARKLLATKEV